MSERFIDMIHETVDLSLIESEFDAKGDGRVYVHDFRSLSPGDGNGSRALIALVELADQEGVTLVLFPKAEEGPGHLSQGDLVAWYERRGFTKSDFFGHYVRPPAPAATPGKP